MPMTRYEQVYTSCECCATVKTSPYLEGHLLRKQNAECRLLVAWLMRASILLTTCARAIDKKMLKCDRTSLSYGCAGIAGAIVRCCACLKLRVKVTGSGEGLSLRFMFVSAKPAPLEAFSAHDLLLCSTGTRMRPAHKP